MTATAAERVVYASKSRKWNSTQNTKFPSEFPTEHAGNLEWIKKTEEEAAKRRLDEQNRSMSATTTAGRSQTVVAKAVHGVKKGSSGRGKWIILGIIGALVAIRAWQRYKENTL
jgi:hypothetical protein